MKVSVLGDLILDKYIHGVVNRVSPEAPVPILDVEGGSYSLGGAGNVCKNIKFLDSSVEVAMIGVLGNDDDGQKVYEELLKLDVDTGGVIFEGNPTTTKTRLVDGSTQIARIDNQFSDVRDWFDFGIPEDTDVLVISDYDLGVVGPSYFNNQIEITSQYKTIVDPKFRNFWKYSGVYCLKPNKKELWNALCCVWSGDTINYNDLSSDMETWDLTEEYRKIFRVKNSNLKYNDSILVTEAEKGMTLIQGVDVQKINSTAQTVFDVTGAGDTVTSVLAYCTGMGYPLHSAALHANRAAGISITQTGCGYVSSEELFTDE